MINNKSKNKQKGITLIALVITIIVLLILAGIAISMLSGENGILNQAVKAKEAQNQARLVENSEILSAGYILEEQTDNGWDGEVNKPQLRGGMIPVKWDDTKRKWIVCSEDDEEWYEYKEQTADDGKSKWGNVMLSDGKYKVGEVKIGVEIGIEETGSMFVWIPRYAYKIENGCGTNVAGKISIKFLKGTTDEDSTGKKIKRTYPEVTDGVMEYYVVHPAFTNNVEMGGWDKELRGIWVAKYEAGFQANTSQISDATKTVNGTDNIVYSDKMYTSYSNDSPTNALGQDLTETGYANEKLSYPVFKALTYAYNGISIGDAYTISQEIGKANKYYGLTVTDSHLMKNSEWGAVAYLAQSNYGRAGEEITINIKNLNNLNSKRIYAVTGYANNNAVTENSKAISSTTKNMTGVFDLSGGVWERTAGYIAYAGATNLKTHGETFTYNGKTLIAKSTKYVTAYPYSGKASDIQANYEVYTGYGDAIKETSQNGNSDNGSWNRDLSRFVYYNGSFVMRGGYYFSNSSAGEFAFRYTSGGPHYENGFRTVLVAN